MTFMFFRLKVHVKSKGVKDISLNFTLNVLVTPQKERMIRPHRCLKSEETRKKSRALPVAILKN